MSDLPLEHKANLLISFLQGNIDLINQVRGDDDTLTKALEVVCRIDYNWLADDWFGKLDAKTN